MTEEAVNEDFSDLVNLLQNLGKITEEQARTEVEEYLEKHADD